VLLALAVVERVARRCRRRRAVFAS
jgi:hypothetical protein